MRHLSASSLQETTDFLLQALEVAFVMPAQRELKPSCPENKHMKMPDVKTRSIDLHIRYKICVNPENTHIKMPDVKTRSIDLHIRYKNCVNMFAISPPLRM